MEDSRKTSYNQDDRPIDIPALSFLVITGLVSVVAQTVALREFLSLCQGSEITLGLGLAAWLAGGAAGGITAARVQRTMGWRQGLFTGFVLLTLLCPGVLVFIRSFRILSGALPGQTVSLGQMAMASLLSFLPLGALVSLQYCLGVACLESTGRGQAAGRAYGLEALGFLIGGLVFTFGLSIRTTASASLIFCSGLCLLGCALTRFGMVSRLAALIMSVLALAAALFFGTKAEMVAQRLAYSGYEIKSVSSSPYGQTVIVQRQGQVSVFYQGHPWLAYPPAVSMGDEETAALGLLAGGDNREILCIGGWELLPILLSQRINTVTLAEPDPWLITGIGRQGLSTWDSLLADPRLRLVADDGRAFVQRKGDGYSLIILSLPYPSSLEWNRFYTLEFFQAARKRLEADGALLIRLPGGESFLDANKMDLAAVLRRTLSAVFPKNIAASGQGLYLVGFVTDSLTHKQLTEKYRALDLRLSFFSPAQWDQLWDVWRRERLVEEMDRKKAGLNQDLHPRALVPGLRLWQAMTSRGWSRAYGWAVAWAPGLWLALLLMLFRPRRRQIGTALTTGASAMGMQMLCLWGLQMEIGTLYYWLGLGNALFMAGTALGSFLFVANPLRPRMLILESAWLIWILIFLLASSFKILPGWGYLVGMAISGLLLGLEFPALVASHAGEKGLSQALAVSPVYAADLAGGMAAAILAGVILIPAWGMAGAAAFLLGLKLVSFIWWWGK